MKKSVKHIFDKISKNPTVRKYFLLTISLLFLSLSFYIGLSPSFKVAEFNKLVNDDSLYLNQYSEQYNTQELSSLLNQLTFKTAQWKLSKKDSIHLIINLNDSLVVLSIKGVPLSSTNISNYTIDPILKEIPTPIYTRLFSKPLPVISEQTTIIKEPIVVRHAPKDTSEALSDAYIPDTLIQNPAFFCFHVEHGIKIIFEQNEDLHFKDTWTRFKFYSILKGTNGINYLGNFIKFKQPRYTAIIKIKLPVDELRVIYRALPTNKSIVLTYNN